MSHPEGGQKGAKGGLIPFDQTVTFFERLLQPPNNYAQGLVMTRLTQRNRNSFRSLTQNWSSTLCIGLFLVFGVACQSAPTPPVDNVVVSDDALAQAVVVADVLPIGTVMAYGGDVVPSTRDALASRGWLVCDGSAVARKDLPDLYRVLGHIHGAGDGVDTFNLPDYRGMFLRGVDAGRGTDSDARNRLAPAPGGRIGDAVGSVQQDSVSYHQHGEFGVTDVDSARAVVGTVEPRPGMRVTDNAAVIADLERRETRPKNVAVYYLIFAGYQLRTKLP